SRFEGAVHTKRIQAGLLGWALFGVWAIAAVVVGADRPGQLLEIALIGFAGAAALAVGGSLALTSPTRALLVATAFCAPLENVWLVRVFDLGAAHIPVVPHFVGNLPSLFLLAAIGFRETRSALRGTSRALAVVAVLLLVGGAVAA